MANNIGNWDVVKAELDNYEKDVEELRKEEESLLEINL
jgi:hypothetical protein